MKIPVVDEDDNQIALKERAEISSDDIYRVSGLWLTNSRREVLLAQRAFSKKNSPGLWGPAVAGTVEEGETYDSNIVKETAEEIGVTITLDQLRKGPKLFIRSPTRTYFAQWYFHTADIPLTDFSVSKDEVAEIRWITPEKLRNWYAEKPDDFLPSTGQWLRALGLD